MTKVHLRKTSEKSVEVNILHELIKCLETRTGRTITVISPTQLDERVLGYDDILQGLPPGRVVAIQFKKPSELKNLKFVSFEINTEQLDKLLGNFRHFNNAFYIFSPFPTHLEFINHRQTLLQDSFIMDIHQMPKIFTQQTYSIRVRKRLGWIEFPINRRTRRTFRPKRLEWICQSIAARKIGSKTKPPFGDNDFTESDYSDSTNKKKPKGVFYIHISESKSNQK